MNMNYVPNLLQNIVHGNYNFCCLCFKTINHEKTELDDEVILLENSAQMTLTIAEIVSYILGDEVALNISAFKAICVRCAISAVNVYNFVRGTKENVKILSNAIEHLNNSFYDIPLEVEDCNTLFLALNPEMTTSTPIYTNEQFVDETDAVEGLHSMFEVKKPNVDIKLGNKICGKEKIQIEDKRNTETTIPKDDKKYTCSDCFKEFSTMNKLKAHYYRLHAESEHKCSQCPKSFTTEAQLNSHVSNNHGKFVCSECGKTFRNLHSFNLHEKNHYLRLVCQSCGRVYKNHNTFKKHIDNNICQLPVRHSPADAKYTCNYCQKKYTQKMTLRVHIQYEHMNYKSHECKWCKKKFFCQSRLKAHIVKHTKEKKFLCTICNGKFVSKESLLYHTRLHTGERPYPCPMCDSKFLSASRRAVHVKKQHTDATVECDICLSKFKSVAYLMKHKKIHETSGSEPSGKRIRYDILDIEDKEKMKKNEMNSNEFHIKEIHIKTGKQTEAENTLNENSKDMYKIMQTGDNVIEIQVDPDNENREFKTVEYYCLTEESTTEEGSRSTEQVYFEVTDYDHLKVSENVEV